VAANPTPEQPVPQIAQITLSTDPEGAEVRINGMLKGLSPLEIPLPVDSEVWLRFDLEGYESLEQGLQVQSDTPGQSFPLLAIKEADEKKRELADEESSEPVIKSKRSSKKIRNSADRRH
jgi:hypothetical protein